MAHQVFDGQTVGRREFLLHSGAMHFRNRLEAAEGYLVLGMVEEAWAEVQAIEESDRVQPDVARMKVALLMKMKRWEEALKILEALCRLMSDAGEFFLHAAFCLHELKQTREAKEMLLRGPKSLYSSALFHYNMACYDAQLGDEEEAKRALQRCFALDSTYRELAMSDPDLVPVQSWLATGS